MRILNTGCLLLLCTTIWAQGEQNTLPTNGNVGIGTTSPTRKLQVEGETLFSGKVTQDNGLLRLNSLMNSSLMEDGVLM